MKKKKAKKKRKPRLDMAQLAKRVVDQATGQKPATSNKGKRKC